MKISKVVLGFRNFGYDFWGVGGMFEGDSADTFAGKLPLVSMGGRAEGLTSTDPEVRTPNGQRWDIMLRIYASQISFINYVIRYGGGGGGIQKITLDDREGNGDLRWPKIWWRNYEQSLLCQNKVAYQNSASQVAWRYIRLGASRCIIQGGGSQVTQYFGPSVVRAPAASI